jgi:hypothetical protein
MDKKYKPWLIVGAIIVGLFIINSQFDLGLFAIQPSSLIKKASLDIRMENSGSEVGNYIANYPFSYPIIPLKVYMPLSIDKKVSNPMVICEGVNLEYVSLSSLSMNKVENYVQVKAPGWTAQSINSGNIILDKGDLSSNVKAFSMKYKGTASPQSLIFNIDVYPNGKSGFIACRLYEGSSSRPISYVDYFYFMRY